MLRMLFGTDPEHEFLRHDENELLKSLRAEAAAEKECYNRYLFACLGLVAALMSAVAGLKLGGLTGMLVAMAGAQAVILSTMVAGLYKYENANRNYGYELHHYRTLHMRDAAGWKRSWRNIGYEEAMKAYRVIQPTLRRKLYHMEGWRKHQPLPTAADGRRWYRPGSNVKKVPTLGEMRTIDADYHGEGFLATSFKLLGFLQLIVVGTAFIFPLHSHFSPMLKGLSISEDVSWSVLLGGIVTVSALVAFQQLIGELLRKRAARNLVYAVLPILAAVFLVQQSWPTVKGWWDASVPAHLVAYYLAVWLVALVSWMWDRRLKHHRKLVEDGLLSIHSSAIVWQAVVVAHHRAMQALAHAGEYRSQINLRGYLASLAVQAHSLVRDPDAIHEWIEAGPRDLPQIDVKRLRSGS